MIITIDGPVASGKSSVARELSQRLSFFYLYTGLLYRAVAYLLSQEKGITDEQFADRAESIKSKDLKFIEKIYYDYRGAQAHILIDGQDVTDALHDISLDQRASIISANKHVREQLLEIQRNVAERYNIIADGRDCGTVVFPDADYKFFLTATPEVRAQRLMLDPKRSAQAKTIIEVKAEVELRDTRDSQRAVAPLTIPDNAIVIDSSHLTFEQTVAKFLGYISK